MHSLQKQFHDFIHLHHLLDNEENVLLAVSGGLDSIVMSHLFLESGISFAIAHCNYGLRGAESDEDEAFVMEWADKYDINCFTKVFDVQDGSIQLEARNARYQWFNELILEHNFKKVATAHHLNDSLETLLINLSRGTGIQGLTGIPVKKGNVIRPLLFADKKALHDYAMNVGLDWREDSSNKKTDYDRNRIRHNIVPELMKINPSLLGTFRQTNERLNHVSDVLNQKVEAIRAQYLKKEDGGFRLEIDWMLKPSDVILLNEILSPFGVNYLTSKEIFEAKGKSGKSFPVEHWLITMDRNTIFVDKNVIGEILDLEVKSFGEYIVEAGAILLEKIEKEDVVFGSANVAHFDADQMSFPLKVRFWEAGDKFQPLGLTGEKKVSDFLIDEKVPVPLKKKVMVLEHQGQIAWLIGKRISDRFKVRRETNEVVRVTFIQSSK